MINIIGRELNIPNNESFIGFEGDNIVEIRQFKITNPKLFDFNFKLDIKKGIFKNVIDLEKELYNDHIILNWEIKEEELIGAGTSYIQLRAFKSSGDIIPKWHSSQKPVEISESINAENYFPAVLPSEFTQMEVRVTNAKNETLAAKDIVVAKALEVNTNATNASESEYNAGVSEYYAKLSENNAKVSETNSKTSEDNAKLSETNSKLSEDNINLIKLDIDSKSNEIGAKHTEVLQKAIEVETNTQLVEEDKQQVNSDKGIVIDKANSVSLDKDITETNKLVTETNKTIAEQKAGEASESSLLAEYYANMAISIVSNMPTRYYRYSEDEMWLIQNPKQGDICYVINFIDGNSRLFVYDITDMDADEINPEWVFIGTLDFANLDRETLLSILQLSPVAVSGDYADLSNKPNRFESVLVLNGIAYVNGNINWNYSLAYWTKVTLFGNATLYITNVYNGAYGIIDVYGSYSLTLPANSYQLPDDWNYWTPQAGQHYVYSFRYDGNKFSWKRSVEYDT